jgi:hypothetical protein
MKCEPLTEQALEAWASVGDANEDVLPVGLSVWMANRAPGLGVHLPANVAPVDSDDCTPGLDYPPIPGLYIAAVIDHAGRVVHEVRIDEEPVYDALLWSEIPDAAHELEGFGHHEAATALLLWMDVDRDDRPSPSDDITRDATWAMDSAR